METNNSRVLIVDDLPINRMILSSLLATSGVLSDQVESGRECLEMCREKDHDLILLDHRMPDMDGVETLVLLKEIFEEKGRTVPVICHTTEEGRKNVSLYKAAGFADVLFKPIDPKLLSEVLMTYLPENDRIYDEEELQDQEWEEVHEADQEDEDELDRLPSWLKTVPHIDLVAGIENCDNAEDYVDALFIFYSSIEEKSEEINRAFLNRDWTMYSLRLHSLKSMARLIGARQLGDLSASLETITKSGEYYKLKDGTDSILDEYRSFKKYLSPLKKDPSVRKLLEKSRENSPEPRQEEDKSMFVLLICSNGGIVTKGLEKGLKDAGFTVITIPDEPDHIIAHRFDADIVLYYPGEDENSHVSLTMNLLGEICQDDSKILCLTGDPSDIDNAMGCSGSHRVSLCYPRPVEISQFVQDMQAFSGLEKEYHRRKNLYVVDDDPDYRSVIERWLSKSCNISCFPNGEELLDGLSAAVPDLILLDYEMPEMDGYALMKKLREDPETKTIPIIFLTGKNDRDLVFKVLENKPDGYLLKTAQKEDLTDAIRRFFAESLFRRSVNVERLRATAEKEKQK